MSDDRQEFGGEQAEAENDLIARRLELDAGEAVATIEGGATGEMPGVQDRTFPGPIAEAFYADDSAVVGIQGPVGSGKTTTLVYSRVRRARMMPMSCIDGVRRYKLVVVRATYRQLWSTTIPSYLETIPKAMGEWSGGRGDPVTHRVLFEDEFGPIEWVTEFLAFGDNIAEAMRGIQGTDFWLNEADTVPVDVLTVGIGRIDRWPAREHFADYDAQHRSYGQIACDFNAPDEDNWTFKVFHDEDERRRMTELMTVDGDNAAAVTIAFHRQPGAREPGAENLHNLSPSYYARQIAAMTLAGRGDQIARLVDNQIVYLREGDPVFETEFKQRIHVSDRPLMFNPNLPLFVGLDQGFTPAAVFGQYCEPGHWTILAELMFPKLHMMAKAFGDKIADLLDERFPGAKVEAGYGDMAGEHGASQAADENATFNLIAGKAAGFRVRPQTVGQNRIQPRLEAVRGPLEFLNAGQPGLLIDPRCKFLIRAFASRYVWTKEFDKSGNKRTVPEKSKVEANVMDALQYLLLSKSKADGTADRRPPRVSSQLRGGPPSQQAGGLQTGWSVHHPLGSRA
jgi:hypothetical protein